MPPFLLQLFYMRLEPKHFLLKGFCLSFRIGCLSGHILTKVFHMLMCYSFCCS
jgi:hypothetical protein